MLESRFEKRRRRRRREEERLFGIIVVTATANAVTAVETAKNDDYKHPCISFFSFFTKSH